MWCMLLVLVYAIYLQINTLKQNLVLQHQNAGSTCIIQFFCTHTVWVSEHFEHSFDFLMMA